MLFVSWTRCDSMCQTLTLSSGFSMSGRAPEAVASLLNIALSSDTRLREKREFSSGDSELALGESGMGSLLAFTRALPKKKPLFEGLLSRLPEPPLMGGGGAVPAEMPTEACSAQSVIDSCSGLTCTSQVCMYGYRYVSVQHSLVMQLMGCVQGKECRYSWPLNSCCMMLYFELQRI